MADLRRREFVVLLGGLGAFVALRTAPAQRRMARIGVLVLGASAAPKDLKFVAELARLGYVEGRNISYDIRAADGNLGRLPALARELVASKPDILISATSISAEALAAATHDIPIILTVMVDPIVTGFSDSMSRPSRNVTGFTSSSASLSAKRLQLLHELIPDLRRVAYMGAMSAGSLLDAYEQTVRDAAKAMNIVIYSMPVTNLASVSEAFAAADRDKVQAVLVAVNPNSTRLGAHIINECLVRDLPSIHPWLFEAYSGALMSYGPATVENHPGVARFVDRILKGAAVSDLPFEEPTEIKLAINLRTAQSMKITVPQALLARADEVIE